MEALFDPNKAYIHGWLIHIGALPLLPEVHLAYLLNTPIYKGDSVSILLYASSRGAIRAAVAVSLRRSAHLQAALLG